MNVAESADLGASGIKKTFRSRGNAGKLPAKVVKHEAGERAGRKLLAERGTGSVERGASRGKARGDVCKHTFMVHAVMLDGMKTITSFFFREGDKNLPVVEGLGFVLLGVK